MASVSVDILVQVECRSTLDGKLLQFINRGQWFLGHLVVVDKILVIA